MDDRARQGSFKMSLGVLAVALASWATPALAEEGAVARIRPGEVTLKTVVIKERVPRPLAALEVSRVSTQKAIPLRAFSPLDRIEGATRRAPF